MPFLQGFYPKATESRPPDPVETRTTHYHVGQAPDGWCVTYEDAPLGAFRDCAAATAYACDLARTQAQIGVVATVVVAAPVVEIHYFQLPSGGAERAAS
jgi:hypothetical protein